MLLTPNEATNESKNTVKDKMMFNALIYDEVDTPVGRMVLVASDKGVQAVLWKMQKMAHGLLAHSTKHWRKESDHQHILQTKIQLKEYFEGSRKTFDLPLCPQGSEFQLRAWEKLKEIPYGQTISYQEQAISLGDKNKVRAVGTANSRNPISIIVPCHRVLKKDGSLHGFAGGLEVKRWLLEHEQRHLGASNQY